MRCAKCGGYMAVEDDGGYNGAGRQATCLNCGRRVYATPPVMERPRALRGRPADAPRRGKERVA